MSKRIQIRCRLRKCWNAMHNRCNRISIDYPAESLNYLGIKVCPEWDNFETFKQWALANGYENHLTLDRRNNHLGYSPDNCRWVTRIIQTVNRRNYGQSMFRGVCKKRDKWMSQVTLNSTTVKYVGLFQTQLEAALAHDKTAFELLGSTARLNFPEKYL